MLAYGIGVVLALLTFGAGRLIGLDRDRAFYPTILMVIASYYVLFAVVGGSAPVLIAECIVALIFFSAAVAGFKSSLWIVVVGLAAHGLFDLVHGSVIVDPGVPAWWPAFCLSFDIVLAVVVASVALRRPPGSGRINGLA
ncbi:MAG TPA: hypothetical protein VJ825_12385 [Gemmatimonadaceae bacterium]|nr:hypothetical protein [Gemmatimonadaceae bacterium]